MTGCIAVKYLRVKRYFTVDREGWIWSDKAMANDIWVTLTDYTVIYTTAKAIAVRKRMDISAEWTWLPRALCQDGHALELGDTDIIVRESKAEEKDLDWS
jgi:hypothetical protein